MKVILKSNFFVEGVRYRKSVGRFPVEIPDHLRKVLPSSAIVVEEPVVTPKVPEEDDSSSVPDKDESNKGRYDNPARQFDIERAAGEAEDKEHEKAKNAVDEIRKSYKKKGK